MQQTELVFLMIEYTKGNLLAADVDALVNTVNTLDVMGKGIALMFKDAFPENYKAYAQACKENRVQTGKVFVTERPDLVGAKWVTVKPLIEDARGDLPDVRVVIYEPTAQY